MLGCARSFYARYTQYDELLLVNELSKNEHADSNEYQNHSK